MMSGTDLSRRSATPFPEPLSSTATHKRLVPPLMTSRAVYGFVPADCVREIAQRRTVWRRVHCIAAGRVAALAGPLSLNLPVRNAVRHSLGRLRTYQQALEGVMRRVPVLPAHFATRLPDRATIVRVLKENEDRLAEAIDEFGHLVQVEVRVTCPRIRLAAAPLIARAQAHIRRDLETLSLAMSEEDDPEIEVLLNATLLLRPFDEARLDAALSRLDGEYGGQFHFNCVGALPPCSFIRALVTRSASSPPGRADWILTLNR